MRVAKWAVYNATGGFVCQFDYTRKSDAVRYANRIGGYVNMVKVRVS